MKKDAFQHYLQHFQLSKTAGKTICQQLEVNGNLHAVFIQEFWTPKQRQANAIHEVSYRACFKPQLPAFFIDIFTKKNDLVYDPFNGRGTTVIEAALSGRNVVANDVNPVSLILTKPRIAPPTLSEVEERLKKIPLNKKAKANIDLSMFYQADTLNEIVALKNYLKQRKLSKKEDNIDAWIRMVATNRLTGHSKGFFSVYTLPPNQAMSAERQKKVNKQRAQKAEYRDVKKLILKKSRILLRDINPDKNKKTKALFLNKDAAETKKIAGGSVSLTVTSPPFLDIVQYADDNWLRCWFNDIDVQQVQERITMSRTVDEWAVKMQKVFNELYRITKKGGIVAFEVGELRNGKVRLEEVVVPLGIKAGFACEAIIINQQNFTKTSNIWGVSNNSAGTNSNRITVFRKK